jgi:hypothetical protein
VGDGPNPSAAQRFEQLKYWGHWFKSGNDIYSYCWNGLVRWEIFGLATLSSKSCVDKIQYNTFRPILLTNEVLENSLKHASHVVCTNICCGGLTICSSVKYKSQPLHLRCFADMDFSLTHYSWQFLVPQYPPALLCRLSGTVYEDVFVYSLLATVRRSRVSGNICSWLNVENRPLLFPSDVYVGVVTEFCIS